MQNNTDLTIENYLGKPILRENRIFWDNSDFNSAKRTFDSGVTWVQISPTGKPDQTVTRFTTHQHITLFKQLVKERAIAPENGLKRKQKSCVRTNRWSNPKKVGVGSRVGEMKSTKGVGSKSGIWNRIQKRARAIHIRYNRKLYSRVNPMRIQTHKTLG
jgi:hypothetical protein